MFVNRLLSVIISFFISGVCGLSIGASLAVASPQELVVTEEDFEEEQVYSPYAGRAYADQVFFGDMHFHTELSFDAGLIGTSLDVHDGYRMARGEKVFSNTGQPVQLIRRHCHINSAAEDLGRKDL